MICVIRVRLHWHIFSQFLAINISPFEYCLPPIVQAITRKKKKIAIAGYNCIIAKFDALQPYSHKQLEFHENLYGKSKRVTSPSSLPFLARKLQSWGLCSLSALQHCKKGEKKKIPIPFMALVVDLCLRESRSLTYTVFIERQ